jgi:subtilisin family serine protease
MKKPAALGVILLAAGTARAGEIDATLEKILDQTPPGGVVSTLVYLQQQVDLGALRRDFVARSAARFERHAMTVLALRDAATDTQGGLVAHLEGLQAAGRIARYEPYWIVNAVRVDAAADEIIALAQRPDVLRVYFNPPIEGIRPVEEGDPGQGGVAGGAEPGVNAVRAPEVWAMGITGDGSLVATLDTGVDGNHLALASRWRGLDPAYAGNPGWAWFDPVTNTTFPQSFGSSHGTHTMGTVCGGPPGNQVGVAPGAQWIHAAVIDRVSIQQTVADAILSFQWLVDPDENPFTDFDVAHVCSNSWGLADVHGYPDCDPLFWSYLDACEAAGIVMIFSAGNEGFSGLRRPADRATDDYRTFAVAAVDGNVPSWPIASFSSRGPTFCTPGGGAAIKPDISAPGVNVISSVPGGGYSSSSGTSMASPHVNGVVALMVQANPGLAVEEIKQIIFDTAFDLGAPREDNDYGWGMVDAFEAVQLALSTATLTFSFPNGRPDVIDPNGGTTIDVVVTGQAAVPVSGSGRFYYSTDGVNYTQVAMNEPEPNSYQAVFPAFPCGSIVQYYFSADTSEGETAYNPFSAPATTYSAEAYSGVAFDFRDDFELDLGWTVVDTPGLVTGTWERGVPLGGGDRADPANDADESGQCYVTGIADGDNDIDGGSTILTSPDMDGTEPDAVLSYYRWYHNTFGADPANDIFIIDISDDGGATWVNLETVGPAGPEVSGGWILKEFLFADSPGISNSSQIRLRFNVGDLNNPSVVEAGVDGVQISRIFCNPPGCPPDLDGDDIVGINDLLDLLAAWGPNPGHPADLDGDDIVGINDLLDLLAAWGPCS